MKFAFYAVPEALALSILERAVQPRQTIDMVKMTDGLMVIGYTCDGKRAIGVIHRTNGNWVTVLSDSMSKSQNFWRELELPLEQPREDFYPTRVFNLPVGDVVGAWSEDWADWGTDGEGHPRPTTEELCKFLGAGDEWRQLDATLAAEAAEIGRDDEHDRRFARYRLGVHVLHTEARVALAKAETEVWEEKRKCPNILGRFWFTPLWRSDLTSAAVTGRKKPAAKKPADRKPAAK